MELARYVGTLNLLGDENRLRLCALLRERELTVSDLVRVTGISQSRVSTHLARLREGGFVRDRRDGQHAFYALAVDTLPGTAKVVLDEATLAGDPTLAGDKKRLAELGRFPESVAGEMERHYSPGRTWQSLAVGLAALLDLGDVLDVGSGDGAAASFVAPYCRSLTCVDTSARMIEAARRRLGKTKSFRAEVADGADLPYPDGSFDAALLFHTLTYAADPRRVVEECARVLRPGGRVVVLSLDRHEHKDLTASYGERHPGLSPADLKKLLARARLTAVHADVACRETKKPHFSTVLATGKKK
ncbi:MAG: metalloregulator ArsR/SmtB family transcription factor [Labilithrix sp.]|nr:metalloregulator ArsR/SmtB family transcription factor [Labilithrix sp.]MCW5814268.1 metalloregulator ArsR/SmtB family transcription factor [Labilithrix sp.]